MVYELRTIFLLSKTPLNLIFKRSTCQSDSQCPRIGRSRCLGTSFILCFGETQSYTVSGKCVNHQLFLCNVGSKWMEHYSSLRIIVSHAGFLGGGRRNRQCNYRQCAECLIDSDCGGNQVFDKTNTVLYDFIWFALRNALSTNVLPGHVMVVVLARPSKS